MPKDMSWTELQLFETEAPQKPEPVAARDVPATVVQAIWDHYVATFKTRGPQPRLTEPRVRLIRKAVAAYGADDVKGAITGCSLADWHMGGNPAGKKYTSIELILRDGAHVERFLELTVAEENAGGFLDD